MPLIRPLGTFCLPQERLMLARDREVRAWTCKHHRVLLLWEYTDLFLSPYLALGLSLMRRRKNRINQEEGSQWHTEGISACFKTSEKLPGC